MAELADVLGRAAQVYIAIRTKTGPHVTPELFRQVYAEELAHLEKDGSAERYGTEIAPRDPGQVVPSSRRSPAKTSKERDRKPPKRGRLEKTPKPKNRDRDPSIELAITEIAGHLTFTPNAVTAWYTLPEVRWAFRPDADREALLMAISEQYAGLAGFRLHLRRTTRRCGSGSGCHRAYARRTA